MQKKEKKKTIQEELNKAVKGFLNNKGEAAFATIENLEKMGIPKNERGNIQKVTLLLLCGTLYGINTLTELLGLYGIKKTKCSKIWRKLTHKQVHDLFVYGSRQIFQTEFSKLLKQSASSQSRASITIVGDESVFQHWLKNAQDDPFFGKFYSGQFQKAVFGYCVSLVGVVLKDTFYPLTFNLVPKSDKEKAKSERNPSLVIMEKGIKEVVALLGDMAAQTKEQLPSLYVSLDNGFNEKGLFDACEKLMITPIFVPGKSETLFLDDKKMNFNQVINDEFVPKEAAFNADANNKNKPFMLRLRVFYKKMNRFVTILVFRFNKSNKVTIIFANSKTIKNKTLRWHFFQRTQIEQFFRTVKHILKIRQSKSDDEKSFRKKIALFFLKALFAFSFRNFCRAHFRHFKTFSFYKLRLNIIYHNVDKDILTNFIF